MLRLCSVLAVALVLSGCASDPDRELGKEMARLTPIEPPTFLNGDVAQLFGNATFSARAEIQNGVPGTRPPSVGELSGRDGSLFFIADEQRAKRGISGGLSVLWDAPSRTAYLLNEPLQAFAPLRNSATNGPMEVVQSGEEDVAGERTRKAIVNRRAGAETTATFVVWRAVNKGDLPVRIQSTNNANAVTITLSRIRLEAPPQELFGLPNGFKKYETTDAMLSELVRRRTDALGARARRERGKYGDTRLDEEEYNHSTFDRPVRPY
jgi:hypothetical protein